METIGPFQLAQPPDTPRLGTDTLALSQFVTLRPRDVLCDLGCGNGGLSLLLLARCPTLQITALDYQPAAVSAMEENIQRNDLASQCQVIQGDWGDKPLPANRFDVAVSNPPYFSVERGGVSPDRHRAAARTAAPDGLNVLCAAISRLLRFGGRGALVYPAWDLAALIATLQAHQLAPKRLQLLHHTLHQNASLVLVEARLGGKPGLQVLAPLILSETSRGQ